MASAESSCEPGQRHRSRWPARIDSQQIHFFLLSGRLCDAINSMTQRQTTRETGNREQGNLGTRLPPDEAENPVLCYQHPSRIPRSQLHEHRSSLGRRSVATPTFHDLWRPRANPWAIAVTVTLATFMEALDSSIANVAMQHIAGTLSASQDEATWVLTSYLVANAMVLPISGWIANRIGRKRFYMSCVFLFTVCSLLCGLAPTLGLLVFFRVLQGAAGGGLQPSEQAILADTFRPEKRSMAFAIYGVAVVTAPAIGPTIGGWIIDNYSWRWIFFLNIPVGIISLFLTNRMVEDPPYLADVRKRREGIDYWGLGLLVVAIGALQIMLDKGQEDDWFASRMITTCAVVGVVGLALFIWRELRVEHPILDLRLIARRNVGMTQLVLFMVGVSLYTSVVLIPQFLQELMGYSAVQAGAAVSSGAIVLMILFPVAGALAPKFDPRWLVAIGFVITSLGLIRMTNITLEISFWNAVSWRAFIALGFPSSSFPSTRCATRAFRSTKTTRSAGSRRCRATWAEAWESAS